MRCSSRCYHRRHGAGSFRRESSSGFRSALAPKSTTPPGPVLGQRTRREAGWRWGVMVDLGPLEPPWTSSKLMFAQQMPIPQVRPGRAHLGRYPGRRGSTPLPRSERQVRRLCAAFEELGPAGSHQTSAGSRAIGACRTSWDRRPSRSCASATSTSAPRWRARSSSSCTISRCPGKRCGLG